MTHLLPYGTADLDPQIKVADDREKRICCYVRGCPQRLRPPTKVERGDVCPEHGIRCHSSGTYAYAKPERNIIASPDLFRDAILRHPFKYETHRLGQERSEDALTWNVFRAFQEAGQLHAIAHAITGIPTTVEPFLYLWGIGCHEDEFEAWPMLLAARRRYERSVPADRPLTEPDIALHLPGRYLILIEAKFTSQNTWYERGKRKTKTSLTTEELLAVYRDDALQMLDYREAEQRPRIFHQLWRNTLFAEWMAKKDHPRTQPFHVNLVRAGQDIESAAEFATLVNEPFRDQFQQITWEGVHQLAGEGDELRTLRRYLETKTAGLKPAFQIPSECALAKSDPREFSHSRS